MAWNCQLLRSKAVGHWQSCDSTASSEHSLGIWNSLALSPFSLPSPPKHWGGVCFALALGKGQVCSWGSAQVPGHEPSARTWAKCWAVGLVEHTALVIKREQLWGANGISIFPGPHWESRSWGALRGARSEWAEETRLDAGRGSAQWPHAVHLRRQPLTSNLSLSPLKGGRGEGRLQSAYWERECKVVQVDPPPGSAAPSRRGTLQFTQPGLNAASRRPIQGACMQKSRPLDHRNYPIDIAQGPRGGREPIKRVSNEALRALCAPAPPSPAAAPAADRRSLSGAFTLRDPRPPGLWHQQPRFVIIFIGTHSTLVSCV